MIKLIPDKKIKKLFPNIDFQVLSSVFSILLDSVDERKKKRDYTITVKRVNGFNSYYRFQVGTKVYIAISELIMKENVFFTALMHEFRHFLQDKIYKIPLTQANYNETTLSSYYRSPVEIDARNYEKLNVHKVMRLYKRLVNLKRKFKQSSDYVTKLEQ